MTATKTVETFDGVRIVYDVSNIKPNGATIVFVHGWTCNRAHWREQVEAFSDRYQMIAIDLAGHGESALGRKEYSMVAFARDVEAVLDQEEVDRAVLVGHSMGGMVILHIAHLLDERIAGLVGADTFKFLRDEPRDGKQAEQWRKLVTDFDSSVSELVGGMFSDDSAEELVQSISDGMIAMPQEVAVGAMKGMADDMALFEVAKALDIPKYTINATGRPADEEAIREAGIELRYLPTMGHFVMNEDPVGFNRLLDDALEHMSI